MNKPKKQTGILWKLSPEKREAVIDICVWARAGVMDGIQIVKEEVERLAIKLLGEEK